MNRMRQLDYRNRPVSQTQRTILRFMREGWRLCAMTGKGAWLEKSDKFKRINANSFGFLWHKGLIRAAMDRPIGYELTEKGLVEARK